MATQDGRNASTKSALKQCAMLSIVLLVVTTAACRGEPDDPETELRAWVAAMEQAAEQEDRAAFTGLIAESYSDTRGHSRADIDRLLRVYFLRTDNIALLPAIDEIRLAGDTAADIDLTVGMAGASNSALGFSADAYRFEIELERQGDDGDYRDWRLLSARWGELGATVR